MRDNSYLCRMNAAMKMTALMAALLLSWCLSAQETTRKAYGVKSDFSLVWEMYPNQRWVVFNKYAVASYFNFGYINSSGTNTFFSTAQDIDVKDIYVGGDVYFCGSIFDSVTMTDVGIWGYFPLSGMPTPTVTCFLVDSMECLNKLEFYQTQWQKHVVMIGTGKNGHDYILDAHYEIEYSPTGGWIMDRTRIPNMEAKFDDIALLSDDVVVSARVPDSTKAYMCYIQKTPLAAGPFFVTSLIRRTQLPIYPSSEVLIQNTRMDTIYAVYKQSRFLTICQFKGENIVSSKRFSMPLIISPFIYATSSLLDVKADKPYKHINVLLSMKANTNQTLTDYRIYHIPLIQFASATSANVHIYNDYYTILHSLGRSKSGTSIAVGAYYSALWGIFRVQDNAEGNCATLQSVSLTTPSMVSPNYLSLTHSDEIIEMRETVMPVSPQSLDMITICQ